MIFIWLKPSVFIDSTQKQTAEDPAPPGPPQATAAWLQRPSAILGPGVQRRRAASKRSQPSGCRPTPPVATSPAPRTTAARAQRPEDMEGTDLEPRPRAGKHGVAWHHVVWGLKKTIYAKEMEGHVFQLLRKMLGKNKCGWKFWGGNFRTNLMAIKCGLVPPCQGRSQATPKIPAMVQQVPGRDKVGVIFWGSPPCRKLAEVTSLSPQASQHHEVRPFVIWSKDHLPGPGAHTLSNWDNPIQLGDLIASGC